MINPNMNPIYTPPIFQTTTGAPVPVGGTTPSGPMTAGGTTNTIADTLGGILGGIGGFLGSTGGQQALGTGAGALLAQQAYQRLGDVGERARREASQIARQGLEQTEFKPFTVTTATGGMMGVGPEGGTTMTVSPEEAALQQQLLGGAGQFYGQAQQPVDAREQAVFERMRMAMQPEEERQRLALEERLLSQGRLGTSSAAFGGATPEQLALATAQEEARNRAMLTAMQQAQAEQAQQAALGGQFLAGSFVPQAQLTAAAQPALTTAQLAQRGQLSGAGMFGQANLMGQIGTGLLQSALQPTYVSGAGGGTTGGTGGGSGGGILGTGKSMSEFLDDVIGLDPSGGGLFRLLPF
jgi:hypothetical protein